MNKMEDLWELICACALKYQQEFYELLPDWTMYKEDEHDLLKQNIGFALFGPPSTSNEDTDTTDIVQYKSNCVSQDMSIENGIQYNTKAMDVIINIFEQIFEYGQGLSKEIYFGVIYNIIFDTKDIIDSTKSTTANENSPRKDLHAIPVFMIRKYKEVNRGLDLYDTWYIDSNGRVYSDWNDYLINNTLPKCSMMIPNDGFYQPDPLFPIEENYSTVWVIIKDSPACSSSTIVSGYIDTASAVLNITSAIGAIALAVTPAGPITAGIAATNFGTSITTGLWTFGRSTYRLYDYGVHNESLVSREAINCWLGAAGSTVAFASASGAMYLARSATAGSNIGLAARVAYNTALIGNISINLVGIGYQGYCIYEKYMETQSIDLLDVLFLASHIMFFGNTVMDLRFAEDIIMSSQGKILKEFDTKLRSKRFRKAYNRIKRNAVNNNANKISENAEIIMKATTLNDLVPKKQPSPGNFSSSLNNLSQVDIPLIRNLLNPLEFVYRLMQRGNLSQNLFKYFTEKCSYKDLKNMLLNLLEDLLTSNSSPFGENTPNVEDFTSILRELQYIDNASDTLIKIFFLTVHIMNKNDCFQRYLFQIFKFIWEYIKEYVKDVDEETLFLINPEMHSILNRIIDDVCEIISKLSNDFVVACKTYIKKFPTKNNV